jgi:hypothetical protein
LIRRIPKILNRVGAINNQNNMSKTSNLIFLGIMLFGCLFSSCEQEESLQVRDIESDEHSLAKNDVGVSPSAVASPIPECTLISADWDGASLLSGQSKTYEIQYYSGAIYKWTVSGSISIVGVDNSNRVTIRANTTGIGSLSVTMDVPGNAGLACGNTGQLSISGGGGTVCSCPSPIIDDMLCVSGGHPYWRFQLNNVSSGDNIRWYTQHATIMTGQGTDYVIVNPYSSAVGGFTLYCEVTKRCSDGSSKSRTAYYTNYYGGVCGNGTTGYSNTCGGGSIEDQ